MLRTLRTWLAAMTFATFVGGSLFSVATPQTSYAASCGDAYFLTMPAWYNGLTQSSPAGCGIKAPPSDQAGLQNYIWTIVLNVIEILLHLVGYLTVGFIIFGGFKYMLAAGSPDAMSKAKTTIANAVIGLVLSILSIAIVNLVAGAL